MTGFWDAMASAGPYANNLHLAPLECRIVFLSITIWTQCSAIKADCSVRCRLASTVGEL